MSVDSIEHLRAQLAELRELRASGIRRSRFGQDETEFRADAELAAAIDDLERRLAAAMRPARRIIYPLVSKGY